MSGTRAVVARVGIVLIAGLSPWAGCSPDHPQAVTPSVVQGTPFDVPAAPQKVESAGPRVKTPESPKPGPPAVEREKPKSLPPAAAPLATVVKALERNSELKSAEPAPALVPAEVKAVEPAPAESRLAELKAEPPKPAEQKAAEEKAGAQDDKPLSMTFAKLAFRYWPQPKDKAARDPFPATIKALNGKKVTIDGYMFPIDFEKGKVRSFLLSRGMFGCCYGDTPQISEVVKVSRSDGQLMPFEAMARVTGTLEVGEEFDSEGYVDSLYRIKAEAVGPAPGGR